MIGQFKRKNFLEIFCFDHVNIDFFTVKMERRKFKFQFSIREIRVTSKFLKPSRKTFCFEINKKKV